MKALVRVVLVLGAATGIYMAFASSASADVVDPASAYQPASTHLMSGKPAPGGKEALVPAEPLEKRFFSGVKPSGEVVATPAPEQVVTQAPARMARDTRPETRNSALEGVGMLAGKGVRDIEAFLGRVTSAGQDGATSGAGGPALVFVVLTVAAALNGRRVLRARWVTDEDAPEFLYAREAICPG